MIKWLILLGVIILICIAEWMREIFTYKITHYEVCSDKLNGLSVEKKIVFLTDLHNKIYGKDNEKLLSSIRGIQPELILVGGDMVVGKANASEENTCAFIKKLTEIAPVYYANGNHEYRMKIYKEQFGDRILKYKSELESSGVVFLENSSIDVILDEKKVQLTGLEVPREYYKKFHKIEMSDEALGELIGNANGDFFQILLAHNPVYMDTYKKWGADLVLSGHLHGGVVRIPGFRGVITPQFRLFPKYSGEFRSEDDTAIIVSKGLGTHTFHIRFLNPAEVVVVHIKSNDK